MKARHGIRPTRRTWLVVAAASALFGGMALTGGQAAATSVGGLFELDGNPTAGGAAGDDWSTLVAGDGTPDGYQAKTAMPIVDADSPTDTSYFTGGGSKDVRDVTAWQHSPGDVAPDKDEILNAFASAYLTGAAGDPPASRDLILNFGADRFANNGDSQMGFWFFRSEVSLNSNGTFNGQHTAPSAAGVTPAHGGDLLVLSDFSGGGSVSTINVYEWVGGKNPLRHIDTGGGSVDCADASHNVNVCAVENSVNNTTAEWSYTPKAGVANKYPTGSFLEGGLNVSELILGEDTCFASFLAETRSSTSTTAQLKDFALGRFPLCTPTTSLTASPTVASPTVILSGDNATLTFSEENDGELPLSSPSVSADNGCSPAYDSGNTDADDPAVLDPGETFVFTCTLTSITSDVTVTAIGHGTYNGKDVTYCTTSDATHTCDADERAQASVNVLKPSTSMSATAATANPTTIHANETSTLSFYETNDGTDGTNAQLVLTNPNVTTDSSDCGSPAYVSGDTTVNSKLDVGETWLFQCTVTPTSAGTTTVVATGHGTILGHDVTYCAVAGLNATQVCDTDEQTSVSVTVINPSTSLTKTASADVTYSYSETNDAGDGGYLLPPTAGSRASFVTDDDCTPVTYVDGDTDNDLKLDDGETWNFTCEKTITGPTASTGVTNTATGHGIDATGDDVTYCTTPTTGKFCDTDERDSVTVTITHN